MITESSDFVVSSPDDDHQGDIEAAIGGCDAQCKACISVVSSWEREEDNWIIKIFVNIQGADLWRFNKHKKRATLGMGEYLPVMNCTLFCGTKGIAA